MASVTSGGAVLWRVVGQVLSGCTRVVAAHTAHVEIFWASVLSFPNSRLFEIWSTFHSEVRAGLTPANLTAGRNSPPNSRPPSHSPTSPQRWPRSSVPRSSRLPVPSRLPAMMSSPTLPSFSATPSSRRSSATTRSTTPCKHTECTQNSAWLDTTKPKHSCFCLSCCRRTFHFPDAYYGQNKYLEPKTPCTQHTRETMKTSDY